MSVTDWVDNTNAVGIHVKRGKYGGTFAHKDIAYSMIRRKTFGDARVMKKWQVIIDATELDEGYKQKYLLNCYQALDSN